ncbi:TetR family transcriptional regulator [Actinomyces sp. oral taxon 448 str. F0400]|nr:TetR family transcriptional regulator [Actinomyces sp. oral taxon 448 str. F0400]
MSSPRSSDASASTPAVQNPPYHTIRPGLFRAGRRAQPHDLDIGRTGAGRQGPADALCQALGEHLRGQDSAPSRADLLGPVRHLGGALDAPELAGALPVAGSAMMSPTVKIPNCSRTACSSPAALRRAEAT